MWQGDKLLGFGLLISGLFGLLLTIQFLYLIYLSRRSIFWSKIPAKITNTSILKKYDEFGYGRSYEPKITFTYEINMKSYSSSRLEFITRRFSREDEAVSFISSYPIGSITTASVNPKNHSMAALIPGIDANFERTRNAYVILIISLCVTLAGIAELVSHYAKL